MDYLVGEHCDCLGELRVDVVEKDGVFMGEGGHGGKDGKIEFR